MSVEANAPMNDSAVQTEITQTADTNSDAALEAVWNRNQRDNGAARGGDGKFAASDVDGANEEGSTETGKPLEGGEGEEQPGGETSTPPSDVPLPTGWHGLEEVWQKIPGELREPIAAQEAKLHQKLSEQGRALASFKPLGESVQQFKEYFNGERGNHAPHEAFQTLMTLQKGMDESPVETLLHIADLYDLRPHLQKMFGGAAAEGEEQQPTDHTKALQAEISQLKQTIQSMGDPSRIDERINERLSKDKADTEAQQVISRNLKSMPLYDQIPDEDLVHYLNRSWTKLGGTASPDDVLKSAYDMAINADPDLRRKAAALQTAAVQDPKHVADAKRANSTNIRSTSTGRPREQTEEEMLAAVFDRHAKG